LIKYIRFQTASGAAYGIVEGAAVHEIRGDLLSQERSGATFGLDQVKLLYPCEPSKILAVGRNYGEP